jgi:hypothetical protein
MFKKIVEFGEILDEKSDEFERNHPYIVGAVGTIGFAIFIFMVAILWVGTSDPWYG